MNLFYRILAVLAVLLSTIPAQAGPNDFVFMQRNAADSGNTQRVILSPTSTGFFTYNADTKLGGYTALGPGLSLSNGVLSAITQAGATGPAGPAGPQGITGVAGTNGKDGTAGAVGATGQKGDKGDTGAAGAVGATGPAGIAGAKGDTGSTGAAGTPGAAGAVGATGATGAAAPAFDFGQPSARTLVVSTAYQASNPAKAAIVTLSPSCQNATTVLASSACTMQIRQSAAAGLTCSTGTASMAWTSTVQLGLAFTQTSGSPFDVKVPIGGYFILCPTSGTFTLTAAEQTAG